MPQYNFPLSIDPRTKEPTIGESYTPISRDQYRYILERLSADYTMCHYCIYNAHMGMGLSRFPMTFTLNQLSKPQATKYGRIWGMQLSCGCGINIVKYKAPAGCKMKYAINIPSYPWSRNINRII